MSLLSTLIAASEAAGHEESSKAPFYIAGGALAVFAVLVSAVGIKSPDFPNTSGPARAVMLVAGLLVAGVVATSVLTA